VCEGAVEVYNLAADMGGMGFIERFRVECLRSILINTHMVEAAYRAGARRYFFSSSACAYNTLLQQDPKVRPLKESDAYPAMAERGYGWEKLMSEMFCQEYWHERGLKTFIARFHNVYGPFGTWDGGREKAPAAICRKAIAAIDTGNTEMTIWGDGTQTRSFMFIEDCLQGIDMITHCDDLIATPINLGSSELVSINQLVSLIRRVDASDLHPKILVAHGASIYAEILAVAEEANADLIVIGSHRPAMKDYLLGTNASRVMRHARCSVLVARE